MTGKFDGQAAMNTPVLTLPSQRHGERLRPRGKPLENILLYTLK